MFQQRQPNRYAPSRRWAALAAAGFAATVTLLVVSMFGSARSTAYADSLGADSVGAGQRVRTSTPEATVSGLPTSPRPVWSLPTGLVTAPGRSTATTPQPSATASGTGSPTSHRTTSSGGADPYGRPSGSTPAAGGGTPDHANPKGGVPDWSSYLPAPQTGMKIFLAGLIGLAVAITGLATLALRRREY